MGDSKIYSGKNDILDEIKEITVYLKQSETKNIIQTRIILSKNYDNLIQLVNNFVLDETIEADNKISIYMAILFELRNLLNSLPRQLEKLFLDFNSLYNFVKMNLASLYYNSEAASSYSKANMLMDLLMEPLAKIEKLPELPSLKTDLKEYSELFVSALNLLMTSFGIYSSLITNMKIYLLKDLTEWSNHALWNFKLTFELLTIQFDARELLVQLNKKNIPMYYHNLLSYINILKDMTFLLPYLLSVYNQRADELNSDVLGNDFLENFQLNSFYKLHSKIENYGSTLLEIVEEGKLKGLINKNDRIEESNFYPDYLIGRSQMQWLTLRFEFYQRNNSLSDILDMGNQELVDANIKIAKDVLNLIKGQSENIQALIKSYYLNPYIDSFKILLPFYSLKAIYQNEVSIFDEFINEFQEFIIKSENTHDLEFQVILAELFTYSQLNLKIDFVLIFTKIYANLEYLQVQPRNYLASIILLINIAPLLSGNIKISSEDLFELGFEHGVVKEQSKINEELLIYQLYFNNPVMYSSELSKIIHRTKLIKFDNSTIFIPDLSKYYRERGLTPVKYIPFNRITDMIL